MQGTAGTRSRDGLARPGIHAAGDAAEEEAFRHPERTVARKLWSRHVGLDGRAREVSGRIEQALHVQARGYRATGREPQVHS
jgi:hypothetical protein